MGRHYNVAFGLFCDSAGSRNIFWKFGFTFVRPPSEETQRQLDVSSSRSKTWWAENFTFPWNVNVLSVIWTLRRTRVERTTDWETLFLMWLSLHCNQEQFKNATTNTFRSVCILIKTMCWLRVFAHTIHFALNNVGFYVLFMNGRFYFSRETFMLY